jgi:hypothetical protein
MSGVKMDNFFSNDLAVCNKVSLVWDLLVLFYNVDEEFLLVPVAIVSTHACLPYIKNLLERRFLVVLSKVSPVFQKYTCSVHFFLQKLYPRS